MTPPFLLSSLLPPHATSGLQSPLIMSSPIEQFPPSSVLTAVQLDASSTFKQHNISLDPPTTLGECVLSPSTITQPIPSTIPTRLTLLPVPAAEHPSLMDEPNRLQFPPSQPTSSHEVSAIQADGLGDGVPQPNSKPSLPPTAVATPKRRSGRVAQPSTRANGANKIGGSQLERQPAPKRKLEMAQRDGMKKPRK
ncbi:hypothetical protein AZE42_13591 [Rhizopogon vesiculosus]|uniref:Uncharacterized protein n=1 Tax=Rhizopogon vesiculosus TaxID=180088 RepID=A0A1J8QS93_9AGAM|nr:hypothetical protein AZE42_13591 [Rhizopogon vesiculosus]